VLRGEGSLLLGKKGAGLTELHGVGGGSTKEDLADDERGRHGFCHWWFQGLRGSPDVGRIGPMRLTGGKEGDHKRNKAYVISRLCANLNYIRWRDA
jgi:hypothetical protein